MGLFWDPQKRVVSTDNGIWRAGNRAGTSQTISNGDDDDGNWPNVRCQSEFLLYIVVKLVLQNVQPIKMSKLGETKLEKNCEHTQSWLSGFGNVA